MVSRSKKFTPAELAEWLRNLTWPTSAIESRQTPKVRATANMLEAQAAEIERLRERIGYMGVVCKSIHEIGVEALKERV